jgi:hypothetical protein
MPNAARTTRAIGPWPIGIVNTVDEHAIPEEGLKDALDCNIDREGFLTSRPTYALLSDASGFSALYELNGVAYAVTLDQVGVLSETAFDVIQPVNGPVGWTQLKGQPVFCDYDGVYAINNLTATQFTRRDIVDDEQRYGVTDMPGGFWVEQWSGRLFVLRGRSLLWSEALDYGTHSPSRNFIRFPTAPTWMAPVENGIFVGLKNNVIFLAGTDPAKFEVEGVSGANSPGCAAVIPNRYLFKEAQGEGVAAVWFGETGFVVGHADGSVVYPQAEQIRGMTIVPRKLVVIDERVYAFTIEE